MVGLDCRVAWMDARRVRLHRVPADHGADFTRISCSADRGGGCLYHHLVDAPGGRDRFGLARRSNRAQDAANDFNPMVFYLQLYRRVFAELLVFTAVSRIAG